MTTTTTTTPTVWAAILTYLETTAVKHVLFIGAVAVALLVGRSWLAEHDARLTADATVKTAQAQIATFEKQQATVQKVAAAQVIVLKQEAATVKTPPQAVTALTTPATAAPVNATPLNVQPVPDAPDRVSVDALPLYQQLNTCKQDSVNLGACTTELSIQKQIDTQKDTEITALKKKPNFWARLGRGAKTTLCAGAGGGVGAVGGMKGAAVGAAAGALVCQLF